MAKIRNMGFSVIFTLPHLQRKKEFTKQPSTIFRVKNIKGFLRNC